MMMRAWTSVGTLLDRHRVFDRFHAKVVALYQQQPIRLTRQVTRSATFAG
jgi:hypothetical protein